MSNKMYNLGDPEAVAEEKDGKMVGTEHGKIVYRNNYAENIGGQILDLLWKRDGAGLAVSALTVTAYPQEVGIEGLGLLPRVGYRINYDVSILSHDGTFQDTKKYVIGG